MKIAADATAPDPSPRPGVKLWFSRRCVCNAIETAARVLCDGPVAPRAYYDPVSERLVWMLQGTYGGRLQAT